ncbi:cytochrome P450 [Infundibulicybe gibba]|nr:cytochrome P450 [Infundibulicybe gibba]
MDAAGTSIVVLNSYKAVNDLLNLRSAIYSSRPPQELMYCHIMLLRLLDAPQDFMEHFRYMTGSIILSMAYGLNILPTANKALSGLTTAAVPGTFLVDSFPILKYVPESFPGAGFKIKAREWGNWAMKMVNVTFDAAEEAIANGTASPSFVSLCLSGPGERDEVGRQVIKEVAANFFIAGTDSTLSTINTFILAMTCYPEAQKKAQQEMDLVFGQSRLPEFSDRQSLPYLAALIKEVLRCKALPHVLIQDDVYEGYHIPRDSVVFGNTWAILHDETEYPDPFSFKPERFLKDGQLNPDVRDPAAVVFGYGRRICPASHIGLSTVWITVASILATFDIDKAPDGKGGVIEPSQEYKPSLICHVLPFRCKISPRSESARALVQAANVID